MPLMRRRSLSRKTPTAFQTLVQEQSSDAGMPPNALRMLVVSDVSSICARGTLARMTTMNWGCRTLIHPTAPIGESLHEGACEKTREHEVVRAVKHHAAPQRISFLSNEEARSQELEGGRRRRITTTSSEECVRRGAWGDDGIQALRQSILAPQTRRSGTTEACSQEALPRSITTSKPVNVHSDLRTARWSLREMEVESRWNGLAADAPSTLISQRVLKLRTKRRKIQTAEACSQTRGPSRSQQRYMAATRLGASNPMKGAPSQPVLPVGLYVPPTKKPFLSLSSLGRSQATSSRERRSVLLSDAPAPVSSLSPESGSGGQASAHERRFLPTFVV
ncbi:hypothetical protein R3P38DRAFT_2771185 [Favolaschia claudopus]|uniref:Uncharacterized protein n=1 Tax=Favolaschia claudopus TaxID=2862362 RepID=A0AAW0CE64_9AGAR